MEKVEPAAASLARLEKGRVGAFHECHLHLRGGSGATGHLGVDVRVAERLHVVDKDVGNVAVRVVGQIRAGTGVEDRLRNRIVESGTSIVDAWLEFAHERSVLPDFEPVAARLGEARRRAELVVGEDVKVGVGVERGVGFREDIRAVDRHRIRRHVVGVGGGEVRRVGVDALLLEEHVLAVVDIVARPLRSEHVA